MISLQFSRLRLVQRVLSLSLKEIIFVSFFGWQAMFFGNLKAIQDPLSNQLMDKIQWISIARIEFAMVEKMYHH